MTWIKLHSYGKECWCDFPNHIHLENNPEGGTCVFRSGTGAYDETPEQIRALIAEAEHREAARKIDAERVERLCDRLQDEARWLGECPIEKPMVMDKQQKRVEEIRAAIRKELGL